MKFLNLTRNWRTGSVVLNIARPSGSIIVVKLSEQDVLDLMKQATNNVHATRTEQLRKAT